MKDSEGGKKNRKITIKEKFQKEKRTSNKKNFEKENTNKGNKIYEEIIPIHCFDCFFTPRLKIIFPEIIDTNSKIKIKYKCPNEHKKILELLEFLDLTQKQPISNIKCSKCKSLNIISEISYCKMYKSFICNKCAQKYYSQNFLIPFEFLDSTCSNHGYINQNKDNSVSKKEIKFDNNIQMKKGDWICKECGTINFQKRIECLKCGYTKTPNKVRVFCQQHLETLCDKCAVSSANHSYELIPDISKEQVDKIYDMINEAKDYINVIEQNFNELIKNAEPLEGDKITNIFNKFKTDNTNLIQLIKVCILSYKQHFFNKDLGINTIYNLISLGKIYINDFIKKRTLTSLENYLLNPCNYIISTMKDYNKNKKYRELAIFYHRDNNIIPLRQNDLVHLQKKETIKTDSSVFKIYPMTNNKILVIFGKLYHYEHASIYNSKFQMVKKSINMGPKNKDKNSIIDYKGILLINDNDDFIYYYEGKLYIFSSSDSYKCTQKLNAFKADIYKDKLIILNKEKEFINIYTYVKYGIYEINNNYTLIMKKPVEEIKILNDNLIYINNSESISCYNINTKEEIIITKGHGCCFISVKIIYGNVIIAYGANSRVIIMIGISVPEIIQKYEVSDCFYCGKVNETSFLLQDNMFLNLFSFESNSLELIGRFEFKYDSQEKILCIPNRRFIFYKEYEYWLYVDDKLPDESYTQNFHIYSF